MPVATTGTRADAVGEIAAERHRDRRGDRLWQQQESGLERAVPVHLLEVERQQQHAAEEGGDDDEAEAHRPRERRVAEEAQLEQRLRVAAVADDEVDDCERGADEHHDRVERRPAVDDSVAEREQQRAGGERHHQQCRGAPATELRQHERREQHRSTDQQADDQQRTPARA